MLEKIKTFVKDKPVVAVGIAVGFVVIVVTLIKRFKK
jgi:preprotein translocase subunit Sec61beta